MTQKIEEVTYLRVLAMFAVVSIHVLNIPISTISGLTPIGQFFYTLRALLIFAVPCFLFLSMMMVSLPLKDRALNYKVFYKKRSYRILLPYLLWTGAYLFLDVIVGKYQWSDFLQSTNWLYWLGFGKAWGHLYFLPILIELLILVPILLPLAKVAKDSFFLASLFAFLPQIGIYWLNKLVIYQHFSLFTSTGVWYYYIGFLGLWFGLNYEKNLKKIKKVLPLLVFLAPIYTFYVFKLYRGESFHTFYYTLVMFLYTFLVIGLGLSFGQWLKEKISLPKRILFLERYSFGIYLIHPLFLVFVRHYTHNVGSVFWLFLVPMIILFVTFLSAYLVKITGFLKWLYGIK